MRGLLSLLLLLAFASPALAVDKYVCVANQAVGFKFDEAKQTWGKTQFTVENDRFLLKHEDDGWYWNQFGDTFKLKCKDIDANLYTFCANAPNLIQFNGTTLRFVRFYLQGYINGALYGKEGENTPYIEIGTCSPLN